MANNESDDTSITLKDISNKLDKLSILESTLNTVKESVLKQDSLLEKLTERLSTLEKENNEQKENIQKLENEKREMTKRLSILQGFFYLCILGILPIVFPQYPLISIPTGTPVPIVFMTFAYIHFSCETYILPYVHFLRPKSWLVDLNKENVLLYVHYNIQ